MSLWSRLEPARDWLSEQLETERRSGLLRLVPFFLLPLVVLLVMALPWWASPVLIIGFAIGWIWFETIARESRSRRQLRSRGVILDRASVRVHGMTRIASPAGAPAGSVHYQLDVAITPRDADDEVTTWKPSSLAVWAEGSAPREVEGKERAWVEAVEYYRDGDFQPDDGWKFEGAQRVRLRVGVRPGVNRLRLAYYGQPFGGNFWIGPRRGRSGAAA